MKRGDIIALDTVLPAGEIVYRNCSSPEAATAFMQGHFFSEYNTSPTWELKQDPENFGGYIIVLTSPVMKHQEAKVNWVIENEIAIQYKDGNSRIIDINEEKDWKVIVESVPSYQSSVAELSDDQLRESIELLKSQRMHHDPRARKPREVSTPAVDKNDPIAMALAGLSPEKKEALMRKLGMV
ncbi:hypothetical protein KKH13_04780 [Patescibacteria group bacterium]|uniref:Uncharacterized protein n=1 Tax=viral metagenome TaxID=1070528 RepID=A0A6M3LGN5_9ZZZZ|nr:hypothetical protein [Patescibacteria group bacterium]